MTDDLLKKIAANFAELSERERLMMKQRFGIDMLPLPTADQVGQVYETVRGKLREFEESVLRRRPPRQGSEGTPPPASTPD
jgi:DNA-directed RNA polymerase sigma subunit (sigma70/sigma32)